MLDLDYAIFALNRMCIPVDYETKVKIHYTDELKDLETNEEKTWIVMAQSTKQKELLHNHKKEIPIFVEGPYLCWIRKKMVEYYVMKTDPLEDTKEKLKQIKEVDDDDVTKLYNMFEDPFNSKSLVNKLPELSAHEQADGTIFAMCCTGTQTKASLYNWTKFLEIDNPSLKEKLVVYRVREKPNYVIDLNKEPAKSSDNSNKSAATNEPSEKQSNKN